MILSSPNWKIGIWVIKKRSDMALVHIFYVCCGPPRISMTLWGSFE